MNCCYRSATRAWDFPGTRQIRSLTPSLLPRLMAPAWDFASAARLSNRMVAACGLPTTLRAAQVFASPYPPKPRQMNDTRDRTRGLRAGSRPSFKLRVAPEILTKILRHADSATTRHYIMLKSRKHGQTAMRK